MHKPNSEQQVDTPETVFYSAWEPSSGTLEEVTFEVNRTREVTRHQFHPMAFAKTLVDPPVLLAAVQMAKSANRVNLRWQTKDLDRVEVEIDDDPGRNTDVVG